MEDSPESCSEKNQAVVTPKASDSLLQPDIETNCVDSTENERKVDLDRAEPNDGRETWGKKIDFLLSVIGFAVDLANVWRFPYLCYKNGGGAFLVPYTIMFMFGGVPLFFMELAIGQFHRKGAISAWGEVSPIFKGIGWSVVLIAFYTDFFYNVILAWALYYFFASFTTKLPWMECGEWATETCFSGHVSGQKYPDCVYAERLKICSEYRYKNCGNTSYQDEPCKYFSYPVIDRNEAVMSSFKMQVPFLFNGTLNQFYDNLTDSIVLDDSLMHEYCRWTPNSTSPAAEYWNRGVLGLHESSGINSLGPIRWQNTLCLLAIFIICYFSLWKGISTSGKVVWFTALFPYVVLFILLIRGVTLPGSLEGILEYITPRFDRILHAEVWVDAATQVFFSLGPGFGVLLAFSSYNKFHNNVYKDAILTSLINYGTSFLAGFVVFSILGYLSYKTCKPFYTVATEGPGLVFEVYPEAIATIPGSTFWSLMFFLMLLTLGLDSSFGGSEAVITGITDEFPVLKNRRELFCLALFSTFFFVGLASCTYGGFYVVRIFEVFAAGYSILFAVFVESLVVSWIYGVWRFSSDIKLMIGHPPGIFWIACWTCIAPVFLASIMIYGLVQHTPLQVNGYQFPIWANVLGWMMAGSSMFCIPLFAIIAIIKHRGNWEYLLNGWWSQNESSFRKIEKEVFCCKTSKDETACNGSTNAKGLEENETCLNEDKTDSVHYV